MWLTSMRTIISALAARQLKQVTATPEYRAHCFLPSTAYRAKVAAESSTRMMPAGSSVVCSGSMMMTAAATSTTRAMMCWGRMSERRMR